VRFTAFRDGSPCGWGLARLRVEGDAITGDIVDVFSARPAEEVYVELVAEMTRCLEGMGADGVSTTASCPVVRAALAANRFAERSQYPIIAFFPEGDLDLKKPFHVMRGTSDDVYLPLPPETSR
jgi:hypothetical protein